MRRAAFVVIGNSAPPFSCKNGGDCFRVEKGRARPLKKNIRCLWGIQKPQDLLCFGWKSILYKS